MLKKLKNSSSKGFTLIELLIVIVIIGILAGVLISVIDPTAQQNRARDANVKAALNKIALATQGYVSAYGVVPDEVQFIGSLDNSTAFGTTCNTAGGLDCLFSVTGNDLPATCSGNWNGTGSTQCNFRYLGTASTGNFTLWAKSFGIANTMFRYQNFGANASEIMHCNADGTSGCIVP